MTIADLIQMANTRLAYLSSLYNAALYIGDTEATERYQQEINTTTNTINQLSTLSQC